MHKFKFEDCACVSIAMPISYSVDLRWRIIWMYLVKKMSVTAISDLCCVSNINVRCYIDRFSQTGEVKPTEYQHGPSRLLGNDQQLVLLRIILQNPGLYLHEIQSELFAVYGQTVSIATICQTLHYMGCTRQALQFREVMRKEQNLWLKFPCMILA